MQQNGASEVQASALAERKVQVKMLCLKPGCPRVRQAAVLLDGSVPPRTRFIQSDCPWHEKQGMKGYTEWFFDRLGFRLDWETGRRIPGAPRLNHPRVKFTK